MNPETRELPPEDYVEPRCVLCGEPYGAEPQVRAIPQQRIIQKIELTRGEIICSPPPFVQPIRLFFGQYLSQINTSVSFATHKRLIHF